MQNFLNSILKLLAILIVCAIFVFFIALCVGFLSDTLSLKNNQFEIILTFVGIIGTFVVISNFHQVEEVKNEYEKKIHELEESFQKRIKTIEQKHYIIEHLLKSAPEYKIAKKVVEQNKLKLPNRFIFDIAIPAPKIQTNGFIYKGVRITVAIINDELEWKFFDPQNENTEYNIDISEITYIKIEEPFEYSEECLFNNRNFINILKYQLSIDNV